MFSLRFLYSPYLFVSTEHCLIHIFHLNLFKKNSQFANHFSYYKLLFFLLLYCTRRTNLGFYMSIILYDKIIYINTLFGILQKKCFPSFKNRNKIDDRPGHWDILLKLRLSSNPSLFNFYKNTNRWI